MPPEQKKIYAQYLPADGSVSPEYQKRYGEAVEVIRRSGIYFVGMRFLRDNHFATTGMDNLGSDLTPLEVLAALSEVRDV